MLRLIAHFARCGGNNLLIFSSTGLNLKSSSTIKKGLSVVGHQNMYSTRFSKNKDQHFRAFDLFNKYVLGYSKQVDGNLILFEQLQNNISQT